MAFDPPTRRPMSGDIVTAPGPTFPPDPADVGTSTSADGIVAPIVLTEKDRTPFKKKPGRSSATTAVDDRRQVLVTRAK